MIAEDFGPVYTRARARARDRKHSGGLRLREHVRARGQKTREGAASAVRHRHDHRHRGQTSETQELFDADKRPGDKCGLGPLLRETPPRRHDDVLPLAAGGGAGASGGAGGVPAGAGAGREVGRGEEERLRAQRGAAAAGGCAAGASAPEAGGGGGRAGVERHRSPRRAPHPAARGTGHALHLGAKPGGGEPEVRAFLFDWVDNTPGTRTAEFAGEDGVRHRFRWLNGAPLNDANFDLEVNFLEYWETAPGGKTRHFSWVTDLPVDRDNLTELMRAARARWRPAGRQERERDFQHPEEPRLRLRAQLRPRREAPRDGAGAPDDAGLPGRPDPAALLRGVPPGAGPGAVPEVPVGADARRVRAAGGAGLGHVLRRRREGPDGRVGATRPVARPPRPTLPGAGSSGTTEPPMGTGANSPAGCACPTANRGRLQRARGGAERRTSALAGM